MKIRPMVKNITKNKLFFKIFMYFLSLLIPIIIIGYISHVNFARLIRNEASEKISSNLQSSADTINIYLNMVQATNSNLYLSDSIQKNLRPYDRLSDQQKVNIPSIIKEIASHENSMNHFIDSIFIYIDNEKIYTSNGVIEFNTYFNKFYRLEDRELDFWTDKLVSVELYKQLQPVMVSNELDNKKKKVVPSTMTQYISGSKATIVTAISSQAISSFLEKNAVFPSTRYFVINSQGDLVAQSHDIEFDEIEHLVNMNRQHKILDKTLVLRVSSESYGWTYYSVTPLHDLSQHQASIVQLILLISGTLLIIGIAFSLIFSITLYNPIRNIKDMLLEHDPTLRTQQVLNSQGEFNFISSSVLKLSKYNQDVTQKMNRYSNERLEQLLADAINGNYWPQKERVAEILRDIGFETGVYMTCSFLFQFKDRFYHEIEEEKRVLIKEKLKTVLWSILTNKVHGYMIELQQGLYVFIANFNKDEDRAALDKAIEVIKTTFEYDIVYCDLLMGIGQTYTEFHEIHKSFHDSLTVIDKHKTGTTNLVYEAAKFHIDQTYYYSFLDENQIVNGLKTGNLESLKVKVEHLIQTNRDRGVSFHFLGHLLVDLFNTGYRRLAELSWNIRDILLEEDHAYLVNKSVLPNELDDRVAGLLRFYELIIMETVVKNESKSKSVVSLIESYIHEQYADDLYLEMIADKFGLSPKYISSLFKNTTGTNISDYIGAVRIAEAKRLLRETEMKIQEIGDRVGIPSRTTFLRQFTKNEGISPIAYRNLKSNRND